MAGWTTIRYLHTQEKSIKAISTELGVVRNAVRLAVHREEPPVYARPARPNPQLASFAEEIERMVVVERFIGSRIVRKLTARNYTGGEPAVYAPSPVFTPQAQVAEALSSTHPR